MKKILLLVCLVFSCQLSYADRRHVHPISNLTIVVSSCDKYAEVWPAFFSHLFKSWPSLKTVNQALPIVFISNYLTYPELRLSHLQMKDEMNWSNSLIKALNNVHTDYVLYLQEDYIIKTPVNEQRLFELLQMMQNNDVAYLQISDFDQRFFNGGAYPHTTGVQIKPKFAPYRTSLQAAIWRKQDLLWLLKPGESPWEFEFAGNLRSQGMKSQFLVVAENLPLSYLNACLQGHWNLDVLNYLKEAGFKDLPISLPIDAEHKLKLWFKKLKMWFDIRRDPYGLFKQ